jgi:DNA-binding transcriptional ArsR family regulator
MTVDELAQLTDLQPNLLVQHLMALRRNGAITEVGERNRQYLYKLA